MNEELINQILCRILSDPALQGLLQGAGNSASQPRVKAEALVLLNYVLDMPRVLNLIQVRWGSSYTLRILPSDQVYLAKPELPAGLSWISAEEALGKPHWPNLILPTCSANTLAKAALGIRDNPMTEMIGRGISQGSSMELSTEYLGFTNRTPAAYRNLYEGYIDILKSYGVMISASLDGGSNITAMSTALEKTDHLKQYPGNYQQPSTFITCEQPSDNSGRKALTNELQTNQYPVINQPMRRVFVEEPVSKGEEIYYTKKFLGDKQAYGFPEASRVFVKEGTVISPLARDTLKLRRIELCIEKGREQG
ncbi:flavoprotein [Desulfosporosinus sp. HMP52]|uniref:flavoprotein n=1 Tax=Desulfosporosinus sp. HMP52 TaxID=1487923 RepID=UPI00051FA4F7|nr:flavoprotein [Desulfosporosinus sp. HMP52]KGK83237.1 flavoprotein [Desulfosporosinus sp. HMP52]